MLRDDVIETITTGWASLLVFAPEKDDPLQFHVDYSRLSEVTIRDSYPPPRMDQCIDSVGEITVFLTLEARPAY